MAALAHALVPVHASPAFGSESAALEAGTRGAQAHLYHDRRGRPIRVIARTRAVEPRAYADILKDAVHGTEIAQVTVLIVGGERIPQLCSPGAGGCYLRASQTIVVPAGTRSQVEHALLHEYGHHLDAHRRGVGPELNGGRFWFRARGIGGLLRSGELGYGNARPWAERVHEMWAEDYAALHLDSGACWEPLGCMTTRERQAMLRDITGRRWPARNPRTIERAVTVGTDAGIDGGTDLNVRVARTGGRLAVEVLPATSFPEDGSTCAIRLYRDGHLLNLASGPGTVSLEWPQAVGGNYLVQIGQQGVGCSAQVRLTVP